MKNPPACLCDTADGLFSLGWVSVSQGDVRGLRRAGRAGAGDDAVTYTLGPHGCPRCETGFVIVEWGETFCVNCGAAYGVTPLPFVRADMLDEPRGSHRWQRHPFVRLGLATRHTRQWQESK